MVFGKIELIQGDITKLEVDAIVNAANSSLRGGGGVDGAIHRAAGSILHEECMRIIEKIGKLPQGEAVATSAGNMPAKYVIHTVGPVWNGGKNNESELLGNCYKNSLNLAEELCLKTIAFPNISTGIYGYPKDEAANIAVIEVRNFLEKDNSIEKIIFACFEDDNFNIYKRLLSS